MAKRKRSSTRYGRTTRGTKNSKRTVKSAGSSKTAMRRKGSYLVRHFSPKSPGRMTKNGKPTRRALAAKDWGEKVPRNAKDKAKLYAKGKRMLKCAKK